MNTFSAVNYFAQQFIGRIFPPGVKDYSQQESAPHSDTFIKIKEEISKLLKSGERLGGKISGFYEDLFKLRLEGLRLVLKEKKLDSGYLISDSIDVISRIETGKEYAILRENLLFALRCLRPLSFKISGGENDSVQFEFEKSSGLTYKQWCETVFKTSSSRKQAQAVIEMLDSSLRIDFVLLSYWIISEQKQKLTQDSIDELSFIAADSAQEFSAIVTELGIYKSYSYTQAGEDNTSDTQFVNEQKIIADLGLDDFEKNYTQE